MELRHNTRIEVRTGGFGHPVNWEPARIRNLKRDAKWWGSLDELPGYHRVTFEDGAILCVHEDGFRIVDNR